MKTGNTSASSDACTEERMPQWSPAMKTGNTITWTQPSPHGGAASMEPGHEDREYWSRTAAYWP